MKGYIGDPCYSFSFGEILVELSRKTFLLFISINLFICQDIQNGPV